MRNLGFAVSFGLATSVAIVLSCGPSGRDGNGNGSNDGGSNGSGSNGQCTGGSCSSTCEAANMNHSSVGCEYYAIDMDGAFGPPYDACYAVFVANVSTSPVHLAVDWGGQAIDLAQFAKLPQGTGASLTYGAFDPTAGLAPGTVAILFLDYGGSALLGSVACPVPAALGAGVQVHGTGVGTAFHITTDTPVVAYQMLPYGGGKAEATGASLLIPTSAWQNNYVAVGAYDVLPAPPINIPGEGPSHNIVAAVDGTTITMRPKSAVAAGSGVPAADANGMWTMTLNRGQYAQITQSSALSGSPITSTQPIGVFGGHPIMSVDRCCGDHGEQMLTPVSALGNQYVAAPHPDREPNGFVDPRVFRIFGAVDGTQLTYDPPGLGAASVNLGDQIEIRTNAAFTVTSQDTDHPFSMFTYMTGAGDPSGSDAPWVGGWGDADFVRLVPPPQYLGHYVFFTDPTYPFTGLTIVRQKANGAFADVTLACMGTIPTADWKPVGTNGQYQIAHEMIVDHFNSQNGCNNGVNVMDSAQPFGVWVWGWGSMDTNTGWVSYGYPAGEAVLPINNVVIE
jgi:IgGFc binding protein